MMPEAQSPAVCNKLWNQAPNKGKKGCLTNNYQPTYSLSPEVNDVSGTVSRSVKLIDWSDSFWERPLPLCQIRKCCKRRRLICRTVVWL